MNKKQLNKLQNEALDCLDFHFPKGKDNRRGDALVVLTIFQMLGRKEMEYIIENAKIKKSDKMKVDLFTAKCTAAELNNIENKSDDVKSLISKWERLLNKEINHSTNVQIAKGDKE